MNRTLEWVYGVVCVGVIGVILYPLFARPRSDMGGACISNIKQSMIAMLVYSDDYDDRLPIASRWMDLASPYARKQEIFHCPKLENPRSDEFGYAMNIEASSKKTSDKNASEFIVLFDSILLARNACSGLYGFPERRDRRTSFAFLDGHARALNVDRFKNGVFMKR